MKDKIIMRCNKCHKILTPDKKESNKNWEVYPNTPCECGGLPEFDLVIPDKKKKIE
jgi:hypothetical protein